MKYIRTKDGRIIDLVAYKENGVINNGVKFVNKINGSYFFIQQDNILKQTETIEELFDGLIVEDKNYKDTWFIMETSEFMKMPIRERKRMWKDWEYNAYIKTKKGLIYKAKMNEEGKLELLCLRNN